MKHGFILNSKKHSLITGFYAPYGTSLISQQQRYPVYGLQAKSSHNYYYNLLHLKSKQINDAR